jgi:hypothetical protein
MAISPTCRRRGNGWPTSPVRNRPAPTKSTFRSFAFRHHGTHPAAHRNRRPCHRLAQGCEKSFPIARFYTPEALGTRCSTISVPQCLGWQSGRWHQSGCPRRRSDANTPRCASKRHAQPRRLLAFNCDPGTDGGLSGRKPRAAGCLANDSSRAGQHRSGQEIVSSEGLPTSIGGRQTG